jgi:hypothetical protein
LFPAHRRTAHEDRKFSFQPHKLSTDKSTILVKSSICFTVFLHRLRVKNMSKN